jgi:hypothetical protein
MHYVYAWSGRKTMIGIFAPINESVWEHLKMTFWPVILWWLIGYFIIKNIAFAQWLVLCAAAVLICPIVILSFYYTYKAFGN